EKGRLTRARIWGATIFVDYATKWIKVHLMQDATGDSTLEAKNAFEHSCAGAPKWEPRSRLGIYVGHSPHHAGSVALVLNPKTGLGSPQYHVVFDNDFSTIFDLRAGTVPKNWAQLVENSRERCVDGFYDVTKTWFEGIPDPSAGTDLFDNETGTPGPRVDGTDIPPI
ncbi:hypothetical protein ACHAWF_003797, partial [Thalassiosira exigua]